MPEISIDIKESGEAICLKGDITILREHRFAWRYMKDYLSPVLEENQIVIPVADEKMTMAILSDISKMLSKYGFIEKQSDTSEKIICDFYEEERKFRDFSQKALAIRNNMCDVQEFKHFTEIIASQLTERSLYDLQLLSAYHLAFSQNACNFSVPGAGKTSIVYGAYAYLKSLPENDSKRVDKLLIVGPLSSFGPWEQEYTECFGIAPQSKRLISGMTREQKNDYFHSSYTNELSLISYASLYSVQEAVSFFLKYNRVMVVLDEAHKAKNTSGGIIAHTILSISRYCRARVVLTGTPAPNGYEDLFNMFKFIWPSQKIIGFEINQLRDMSSRSNDARVKRLIESISPFFIRIRKSDLSIPEAIIHPPIAVEMGDVQRRIYDYIEKKYIDAILEERTSDASNRFKSLLLQARTIRLMQAATDPSMLRNPLIEFIHDDDCPQEVFQAIDDYHVLREIAAYETAETPAKYSVVKGLVEDIISHGGRVVIWATFIHTILELKKYLCSHGIMAQELYGAIPVEQEGNSDDDEINILTRERIVKMFMKNNSPYKVIIANPFAVSESISLHKACHYAIYIERSFNAAHFVQSKDRIHRYGLKMTDETHYYYILSKDSIDETIESRLIEKEKRMTEIMESMPIPLFQNVSTDLGDDDIKALIKDYVRRTKKV